MSASPAAAPALVTGAASGIGAAVARMLAAREHPLVLADLDPTGLERTLSEVRGTTTAISVTVDLTSETGVANLFDRAVAEFGRIELLHNNAGILGGMGRLSDIDAAEFDRTMTTNARGPFLVLREFVRRAHAAGHGGAAVVTATAAGIRGSAHLVPYTMSKHALVGLTRSAALEVAAHGIRVNAVCPGRIDTPMAASMGALRDETSELSGRPISRKGTPEEVAGLVVWLLGPESTFVTGAAYPVDGGYSA